MHTRAISPARKCRQSQQLFPCKYKTFGIAPYSNQEDILRKTAESGWSLA